MTLTEALTAPQIDRAVNQVLPRSDGNRSHQDVLQAARIGVWKAHQKFGEDLTSGMIFKAAKWAALTHIKKELDLRKKDHQLPLSLDRLRDDYGSTLDPVAPETTPSDLLLDVLAELDKLPDWERIYLRDWLIAGCTAKEAAERAGVTFSRAQSQWSKRTRPQLARRLAVYSPDTTQ